MHQLILHEEEDKTILAESLRFLRTLSPDLLFGSAFTGEEGFEDVSDGSWPKVVDEALRSLMNDSGGGTQ